MEGLESVSGYEDFSGAFERIKSNQKNSAIGDMGTFRSAWCLLFWGMRIFAFWTHGRTVA